MATLEITTENLHFAAPETRPKTDQWAVLAGMRFLLAMLVFLQHAPSRCTHPVWIEHISKSGSAAVLCFFLISGYSIAASITEKPKGFLKRRFYRIYPLFFVCIVLSALPFRIFGNVLNANPGSIILSPGSPLTFLATMFMLQGIIAPTFVLYGAAWSLGCESLYYLCAPVLSKLKTNWLAIAMLLSVLLFEHFIAYGTDFPTSLYGKTAAALAWAWLAGFLSYRHPNSKILQIIVLTVGCSLIGQYQQSILTAPIWILTCLAIFWQESIQLSKKKSKVLLYAGELSYPLYLCHGPIIWLLLGAFHVVSMWTALVMVLGTSIILYYSVDLPSRRRGRC